jgi:hypothetical protein
MAINNNRLPTNRLMDSDQKSKKRVHLYFYLIDKEYLNNQGKKYISQDIKIN